MSNVAAKLKEFLLIVLSPERYPITRRISRPILTPSLAIEGEQFTEITNDDFFGFYDWLRPEKGKIIGLHIHDAEVDLGSGLLRGVEIVSPPEWAGLKDVQILFGPETKFDERLSCDQDFGDNGIFHGSRGSVALLFNAPPKDDVIAQSIDQSSRR